MRTEIDVNESEIYLNECEHFLKPSLSTIYNYIIFRVTFSATGPGWVLKRISF